MSDLSDDHAQWLDYTEQLKLYHDLYGEPEMKVGDVYKSTSNGLKAADLQGKAHRLRIASWEVVEFDGKSGKVPKVVLSFEGRQKTLVCNKTNSERIAEQHGEDIDGWVGKEITIFPTKVDFGGEMVDAIRVKEAVPEADPEDDIPF